MKLLICDEHKINFYNLPNKVEDFYVVDYTTDDSSVTENITLEAVNGVWTLAGNEALEVREFGSIVKVANLSKYNSYTLKFNDLNNLVTLLVMPDLENFVSFSLAELNEISIGSDNNSNIIYNDPSILLKQALIKKVNGNYIIQNLDKNSYIYLNRRKVEQAYLFIGDVLYINCIKIIWMGSYIKINNPKNKLSLNGLTAISFDSANVKNDYTPLVDLERNIKLYNDNDIFFHTPHLRSIIKPETIDFEAPPEAERSEQMPLILTIGSSSVVGITACMTGIYAIRGLINKTTDWFSAIVELIMCLLMLIVCIIFPVLTDRWERHRTKKKEKLRQKKYSEYLEKKKAEIAKIIETQERILFENNYPLEDIQNKIATKNGLWSREIADEDFLTIRLGIGSKPAALTLNAPLEQFSLYDDNLRDEVNKITQEERLLKDVPITISLLDNKVLPLIINCSFKQKFIDSMMLQILYYYSGADLKIAVLTTDLNEDKWDYIKYLPHNLDINNEDMVKLFATNEKELQRVSMYLEKEYDKRISAKDNQQETKVNADFDETKKYLNFSEYYLIITDNFKAVKNSTIINKILNSDYNVGFSLLIIESSIKNLPSKANNFVSIEETNCGIFNRNLDASNQLQFKAEYLNNLNIGAYAKFIGNIPVLSKSDQANIPTTLSFLDMYRVGRVDQLNVLSRWNSNDPTTSLAAPVGEKENEQVVNLDLHEKFHGPHGLIAGSTGSGKSEFIITYILSMAINYHPDEVQFVLIDYKGGGLAGAFENKDTGIRLPHLIGTITNLDKSEMNRTLVSIKSELQRRQIKFNEARDKLDESTIDIYKYQRLYREGKVDEPIAHLFVISDEFAELKDQQPDFMDELISTARIGRSLGVHLILATQKPAGVVNDQIWSNSRFKICLRVQTTEDSYEMLKRNEAANIKDIGRFYLQVGNDEMFELAQSAWAGAKYIPDTHYVKKINDAIDFINDSGSLIKSINNDEKKQDVKKNGDQLLNIVKYLYDIGKKENIPERSLWLPAIPNDIYLDDLLKKYNYKQDKKKIMAVIGEYDKPAKQSQGLYTLDITENNTVIFGLPGSGKETLLTTAIYSLGTSYTPQDVQFYILDFGSEVLNVFNKMPHVGDILLVDDKDKIAAEFEMLEKEIRKRKELFADYAGDYATYCNNSGSKVPLIVTILNSYESFMENCNNEYDEYLSHLLREGSKYGIVFIVTVASTNSIRNSLLDNFSNKIILQTADNFDYQYFLGAPKELVPKKVFGRGIAVVDDEASEIQVANITLKEQINDQIKKTNKALMDSYQYKVHDIKILPKVVTLNYLKKYITDIKSFPIGITRDTAELANYNFTKNKATLVTGNSVIDDLVFMCGLIDLFDSTKSIKLSIFDFLSCVHTDGGAAYYNSNFKEPFKQIILNNSENINIYVVLGISNYKKALDDYEQKQFLAIMKNINMIYKGYFVIIDNYANISNISNEEWFKNLNIKEGIWVGNNIEQQEIFKINNLKDYDVDETLTDLIYTIDDKGYTVVKGVGREDEII